MTVDVTKIKPGDTITVELVVGGRGAFQYGSESGVWAGPIGETGRYGILDSVIVGHTPKPPEIPVGTMFGWAGRRYKILFVDDYGIAYRGINTRDTCAMAFSEFHKGLLSGLYKTIPT